jgi:hypothetical protein
MWSTTIVLHRPFMETWLSGSDEDASSSARKAPHEVCLNAAHKICSTIEMYTRYMCGLPCDLVFPIFVAANILQRHRQRNDSNSASIAQRLELCVRWLNGLGKSWKSAEPRRQFLSECESCVRTVRSVTDLTGAAMNPTGQDAPIEGPQAITTAPAQDSVAEASMIESSNVNFLSMGDDFDLDYSQWLNSLDIQGSVSSPPLCCIFGGTYSHDFGSFLASRTNTPPAEST